MASDANQLRVAWASEYGGLGNALGHSLGARLGREAAISAGILIDPDAPIAVHHLPPHCFQPIPGKVNVLWCAWEFQDMIPAEVDGLKRADVLFCTAKFLVNVFEKHSGVPTFYVPQGIRTEMFPFVPRELPNDGRFRYLWVGAPNDRKGWRHVLAAWKHGFAQDSTVELFLKTTFQHDKMQSGHFGNVIVETSPYSDADMAKLYASAHAFVFPSMGEGFGFTLGEAMSTGLPCVTSLAGGCADLADASCVYPVAGKTEKCFDMLWEGKTYCLTAFSANVPDLARKMRYVRRHYNEALARGKRASERIASTFTWRQSGEAMRRALEEIDSIRMEKVA